MITEAYARHVAKRLPRGDEDGLHVSDLLKCQREVWARRKGLPTIPTDADTARKWDFGLDFEEHVYTVLKELDWCSIEHNPEIDLDGVIGHADFILTKIDPNDQDPNHQNAVIEVKTTTFFPKMVNGKRTRVAPDKDAVNIGYRIQAASYALARGIKRFCVVVCCRESGMMGEYWYDVAPYIPQIRALMVDAKAKTDPNAPEPEAKPPAEISSWACKYCRHSACEKNTNPAALRF